MRMGHVATCPVPTPMFRPPPSREKGNGWVREANEHLDFAIAEFREMKMGPSLERALRHKGLLKA